MTLLKKLIRTDAINADLFRLIFLHPKYTCKKNHKFYCIIEK